MGSTVKIPCTEATRDQLRGLKRGGDTYDDVLQKMIEQYNPDATTEKQ